MKSSVQQGLEGVDVRLVPADLRVDLEERISTLIARMTLEEKAGQLNQIAGSDAVTGLASDNPDAEHVLAALRDGRIGSILNVVGVEKVKRLQRIAVEESRLKIPLIFGFDVIHGYFTAFPIPLAEAAAWDLPLVERAARVAAIEASSDGVHWTFAPMVDICRDARWGRVLEGAGEDPCLGSLIAAARVRGFRARTSPTQNRSPHAPSISPRMGGPRQVGTTTPPICLSIPFAMSCCRPSRRPSRLVLPRS